MLNTFDLNADVMIGISISTVFFNACKTYIC